MFKPLLASPADLNRTEFPVLASPKLDGIRCLIHPDLGPVSRTLKPIPNRAIRVYLSNPKFKYLDGEIVTYTEDGDADPDRFHDIQSKVMKADGEPIFTFHAFDSFKYPMRPFEERLAAVYDTVPYDDTKCWAAALLHDRIEDMPSLSEKVDEHIADGFEGTMVRAIDGHYKYGRSTAREGILVKVKAFFDDEAEIIGVEELQRKAEGGGKVPGDTLGALVVRWRRKSFNIGTGFDAATRQELWRRRDEIIGQSVTFRYQEIANRLPRFPVFAGIRYDLNA